MFKRYLGEIKWTNYYEIKDVEEKANTLIKTIEDIIKKCEYKIKCFILFILKSHITDHFSVMLFCKVGCYIPGSESNFNIVNINSETFKRYLGEIKWTNYYEIKDVEEKANTLIKTIQDIIKKCEYKIKCFILFILKSHITDHFSVMLFCKVGCYIPGSESNFNIVNINSETFKRYLGEIKWTNYYEIKDVEEKANTLIKTIQDIIKNVNTRLNASFFLF
ncbi:hypothetical protein WA026_022709 [Henosepilachna vigintioctopunctata]|uniref:Uncharacterized protein n=1 Tax=Henosepilachna vigintioctopunctata TaxID=420089 RepID=A0AAW1TPN4_9CUCU